MFFIYFVIINELIFCTCFVTLKYNDTTIVGKKLASVNDEPYAAFYNIPYADPPVGDMRFKPSREKLVVFGQRTYDYSEYDGSTVFGLEDCLYLSIYMPIIGNMTERFPILVWICDYDNKFGPDFFIEEKILLVIVKYRTGIFGFLNTDDELAEGNMGAKDVVTALKWIRKNVIYYNGDSNKITILGIGDAATLAASMLVSPMAEGLFNGAIIVDGSALSPAVYRPYSFEILNKMYWKLKGRFDKFDRKELYENLKNMTSENIIALSKNLYDSSEVRNNQRIIKSFSGTIETSKRAFINKSPLDIYKGEMNSKVNVIFGYSTLISLYQTHGLAKNRRLLKYLNYNFQYLLPFEGKPDEYESKRYKKIKGKIMEFYFLNGTITERSLRRYAKYVSDQYLYPIIRQANLQSESSPVYLFRFAFKGSLNIGWNTHVPDLNWVGATYGDLICYLFRCTFINEVYTSSSKEMEFIKRIVRLLSNFIKCGNPTPEHNDSILSNLKWLPLEWKKNIRALNLNRRFKMVDVPEERRTKFWDSLKKEFFL